MTALSPQWDFLHCRADSRLMPSQCETALLCNDVSHWLGASLDSALILIRRHLSIQPGPMPTVSLPTSLSSYGVKESWSHTYCTHLWPRVEAWPMVEEARELARLWLSELAASPAWPRLSDVRGSEDVAAGCKLFVVSDKAEPFGAFASELKLFENTCVSDVSTAAENIWASVSNALLKTLELSPPPNDEAFSLAVKTLVSSNWWEKHVKKNLRASS